jgi:poly(A) polymerase
LLLHDIAKPRTRAQGIDGRPTFHGHEVVGAREAERLLRRLRHPAAWRRRVCRLVLFHLRPHHLADAGAPERGLRRLVRDAGADLPLLVLHAACDARASGAPDGVARWRKLLPVLRALLELHAEAQARPLPHLVDGNDVMRLLGIPPGPEVGRFLQEIRELQEQGLIDDRSRALARLEAIAAKQLS